jgi:chorismate mutase
MPDTQPPAETPALREEAEPAPLHAESDIAGLRAEIDALDDQLHDTLMRRAEVVARLAASRAKGMGPALRPGREAAILRRLLARHAGPLPRGALVRLWRELLAAMTAMQSPLPVAACLPEAGVGILRAHLGLSVPVVRFATPEAAIAEGVGTAALVALPLGRWWRTLDPTRLQVVALLPFHGRADETVFLLSPAPPDPSGEDRSLIRLPAREAASLPATILDTDGDLALAEIEGFFSAVDERLPPGTTLVGAYASPIPS